MGGSIGVAALFAATMWMAEHKVGDDWRYDASLRSFQPPGQKGEEKANGGAK